MLRLRTRIFCSVSIRYLASAMRHSVFEESTGRAKISPSLVETLCKTYIALVVKRNSIEDDQ